MKICLWGILRQRRLRSACTSMQCDQDICFLLIDSLDTVEYEPAHNKTYNNQWTHISLCIPAVWLESLLIASAFCSLWAIQRGISENPCHTGRIYRLSLCWSHRSYCRFCCALAYISMYNKDPIQSSCVVLLHWMILISTVSIFLRTLLMAWLILVIHICNIHLFFYCLFFARSHLHHQLSLVPHLLATSWQLVPQVTPSCMYHHQVPLCRHPAQVP